MTIFLSQTEGDREALQARSGTGSEEEECVIHTHLHSKIAQSVLVKKESS